MILEILVAGELGKIARLLNASEPQPVEGLSIDFVNPDGQEFNLSQAIATSSFSSLNSFWLLLDSRLVDIRLS